jgi:hypothetical protein
VRNLKPTLALVAALIALGAMLGCAGQSGKKASARRVTIASSNVVVIDRTGSAGLVSGRPKFRFPAHVTVTNRARIRALVAALERLRRFPKGLFACPMDLSLRYVLRFESVDAQSQVRTIARVTVDPSGCETVTGLGYPRRAPGSASLWRVLGEAVGVPHATVATFQGRASP